MKELQIGVIGCGLISSTHLNAIVNNKKAKLVIVCDVIEERARNTAEMFQCSYSTNVFDIINRTDIDVIHVLTPHYNHYELASAVISSGKHCLLEKPMTINSEHARKLVQLSDQTNSLLGIVFQNRLNTTSQYIKNIIEMKTYGELKGLKALVTWSRDENYYLHDDWRGKWHTEGGGVLINQAIHTLDLLQWFGGEIDWISGSYGSYRLQDVIEVEDTASLFLQFKNNVRGFLFATNNHVTNSPVEMELVFEQGILILSDNKLYLKNELGLSLLCMDVTPQGDKAYWGLGHELLIDQFYLSILTREIHYISAREGAQTIEILTQFYQNANKLKRIKVENTMRW